jgi:polyhydroxyalkanoate synthase
MNHPPPAVTRALGTLVAALERTPGTWQALGRELTEHHLALWQAMVGQTPAHAPDPELPAAAARDRRFSGPAWQSHPWFDYLRQAHLLNERWLDRAVDAAALDPEDARHTRFFLRQWLEAMSPANFAPTNPEVLALAAGSRGETLARGLQRAAEDMRRGALTMTDEGAFVVGGNLALTPGSVIHRNEIAELIHYRPAGQTVHARPLLIVPPFINKYYILDLQPGNSFVRFALEQGLDVYLLSWRNAPAELGHLRWEDYAQRGVLEAIRIVREISGAAQVGTLGFCVGGTLLCTALALAAARGEQPAATTTLLATMLDFSDVGDIGVYIDRDYVESCERRFDPANAPAVMSGRDLAFTFASLRANDLIWRFVVDHWLKGKAPEPFDLLYWNSDATSLPGVLYAWYLRQMYFENNLRHPGRVQLDGMPLDLRAIRSAWYLLAAEEDHIVPWRTAWRSRNLLRGHREFVLAASGHIAGVVNPATRNRRHYHAASGKAASPARARTPDAWMAAASRHEGSWWTHWAAWLKTRSGRTVKAPDIDAHPTYRPLAPAPGRYVLER